MDLFYDRDPFGIPYCLDTVEDVALAKDSGFLGISNKTYNLMLTVSKNVKLHMPPALLKARKAIIKEFYSWKENKTREFSLDHTKVTTLQDIVNFNLIVEAIPWCRDMAQKPTLYHVLQEFPDEVREACKADEVPSSWSTMLESAMTMRRYQKEEMYSFVSSKRSKTMSTENLRKFTTASAIFEPENQDILESIRRSIEVSNDALYQHACAELLFVRIPKVVRFMVKTDPKAIRNMVLMKISKLKPTPQQKIALFTYWKPSTPADQVNEIMDKIAVMGRRIFEQEKAEKLHNFILSLKRKIGSGQKVYEELFLTPELKQMSKLHVPGKVRELPKAYTYKEIITKVRTNVDTLTFYPAKDYLDIAKARISDDCTGSGLAETHLATPEYFSVRIFKEGKWIGNMYMLDFVERYGVILVDRIQIPRDIKAEYIDFFEHLGEVFKRMFIDVECKQILLPAVVSNHRSVQRAFNNFKKRRHKMKFSPIFEQRSSFDSFRRSEGYWILCMKK